MDAGNLRIDGMLWDTKIEVDKKDRGSVNGEILRVSADDPEAQQKLAEAAKDHKGTELVVKEGNELVLYASDEDFDADDIKVLRNGDATKLDGSTVKSPATGSSEAVVALFTDDDVKVTPDGFSAVRAGIAASRHYLGDGSEARAAARNPENLYWKTNN